MYCGFKKYFKIKKTKKALLFANIYTQINIRWNRLKHMVGSRFNLYSFDITIYL